MSFQMKMEDSGFRMVIGDYLFSKFGVIMIYTVTLNPAIDYVVHTDEIVPGATNRSKAEEYYYGGKGINVSAVLKELGISSCAMGFIAGFTGDAIEKGVKAMGIETDFVRLKEGNSRINVKIKESRNQAEKIENTEADPKTEAEIKTIPGSGKETGFSAEKETETGISEGKDSVSETEINGRGPDIDGEALDDFFHKLERLVPGDILVLSGSIPGSLPGDIYEKIMEKVSSSEGDAFSSVDTECAIKHSSDEPAMLKEAGPEPQEASLAKKHGTEPQEAAEQGKTGPEPEASDRNGNPENSGGNAKNIRVVVDAEGRLLWSVLKHRPFLVKPNRDELGALFGVKINSTEDAFFYAGRLKEMGSENVLVSLGAEGAILLDSNNKRHFCKAPEGLLLNSVGSGDSMVAGFIAGLVSAADQNRGYEENALRLGVAAGSATAFSPGLASGNAIEEMRGKCIPAVLENALMKEPMTKTD